MRRRGDCPPREGFDDGQNVNNHALLGKVVDRVPEVLQCHRVTGQEGWVLTIVARDVANRFGVGSGVGVGAGDPTVFAVKKSIARPSSRSAKIQPPSAIMSRWPPGLVRRRLTGCVRGCRA